MAGRRRSRLGVAQPQWSHVRCRLHMRLKDVSKELNVSIAFLRNICHENGYSKWPGKQIRYMRNTGKNLMLARRAGLLGPGRSKLGMVVDTNKEKKDMTKTREPVANHPTAGKELTTLNLIDKVGLSSAGNASN